MFSFMFYDLTFLVIFSIAIGIFLYLKRKNLKREGLMFLYRTNIGLKIMDNLAKKYPKTIKILSYIVIVVGYALMALAFYFLAQLIYAFTKPAFVKLIKVPPIMPLIPYLPSLFKIDWLPPFYFTYWIAAIAIIAIAHEGCHGIFARFYNVRIKSTGFGFLGPFLAFFVEQDEKQMQKAKPFPQMSILGAGVFANVIMMVLFSIIFAVFFYTAYSPAGVMFNDYSFSVMPFLAINSSSLTGENLTIDGIEMIGISLNNRNYLVNKDIFNLSNALELNSTLVKLYWDEPAIRNSLKGAIIKINDKEIRSAQDISSEIRNHKPYDNITLQTKYKEGNNISILNYTLALGEDYENESRAIIGIATVQPTSLGFRRVFYTILTWFKDPSIYYEPKAAPEFTVFIYNLFLWIILINASVAIVNMLPLGIFDGGRFFYLTILTLTKNEKIANNAFKLVTLLLLGIVCFLMILWIVGIR